MSPFKLIPPSDDPLGGNQVHVYYNFEWYKFIAYAVRQIIPEVVWDSPPADIGDQVDTLVYLLGVDVQTQYPEGMTLFWYQAHVFSGNPLVLAAVSAAIFGHTARQNPALNGDILTWRVALKAGTYNVRNLGRTANSFGKIDWKLNGVNQTTGQDWYSAATTENVEKTWTLTVPSDGVHTLASVVNGKNASSSAFVIQQAAIFITP